jgi:hypothetical protein
MAAPPPRVARDGARFLLFGATLAVVPGFVLLLGVGTLALGGVIAGWQLLAGLGLGAAWAHHLAGHLALPRRVVIDCCALVLAVLGGSALACVLCYDLWFDGQNYHQLGISALAGGWNPFREPHLPAGPYALYAVHYSKGPWIAAAALYELTGAIESAKAFHPAALVASFFLVTGSLRYTGVAPRAWAAAIGAAAAFNPISIVQAMTFYVDGLLASLLTMTGAALLLVIAAPQRPFFLLAGALLITLANVKFTGPVYGTVLVMAAAVGFWWHHRSPARTTRLLLVAAAALLGGIALVGYQPYVTNTLDHGHPFHPLRGPGKQHDVARLRPDRIAETQSTSTRLMLSVFADAGADWRRSRNILKLPFTTSAAEFEVYGRPDARVGGWGPFFSGGLLLSGLVLALAWVGRRPGRYQVTLALLALIAAALLNSECWWARFAPQLALLPAVAALALVPRSGHPRGREWLAVGALVTALASSATVIAAQAVHVPRRAAEMHRFLHALAAAVGPGTVYIADAWTAPVLRLRGHGIRTVAVPVAGEAVNEHFPVRLPCRPVRIFPHTFGHIDYCIGR